MIAAPVQVRREAVHRLHRCLGHASIKRIATIRKRFPAVTGSLTSRDLALFTTCPACRIGDSKHHAKKPPASTRAILFGTRIQQVLFARPPPQATVARSLLLTMQQGGPSSVCYSRRQWLKWVLQCGQSLSKFPAVSRCSAPMLSERIRGQSFKTPY